MTKLFKTTVMVLTAASLAACVASETGEVDYNELSNRTNNYAQINNRVAALDTSSYSTMNNASGTAVFNGVGTLTVGEQLFSNNAGNPDAAILGDARVNVNFNSGKIDGSVTNLYGLDASNRTDNYSGSIQLTNGVIGVGSAGGLVVDYAGSMNGNGDRIAVNGDAVGNFKGDSTPRAVEMFGTGGGTLNGRSVDNILLLAAER